MGGGEQVLREAHEGVGPILGSTTALLALLRPGNLLEIANVGDSGFRLLRDGSILFSSSVRPPPVLPPLSVLPALPSLAFFGVPCLLCRPSLSAIRGFFRTRSFYVIIVHRSPFRVCLTVYKMCRCRCAEGIIHSDLR